MLLALQIILVITAVLMTVFVLLHKTVIDAVIGPARNADLPILVSLPSNSSTCVRAPPQRKL